MVGPVKNPLRMFNPQLLILPVFKDIKILCPFMYRNSMYALDLVGMRQHPLEGSGAGSSWGQNEYGPCWSNVTGSIETTQGTAGWDWNNFTMVIWASTISSAETREILGGVWVGADDYIRFGRSSNTYYIYIKSGGTSRSMAPAVANNNDGNIHCWILSSKTTGLDGYFDGALVGSAAAVPSRAGAVGETLEIGDNNEDYEWIGDFSLAMVWNRGLSPSEARQIYEMGPSLTPLRNNFPIPYRGAVGVGTPSFNAAWAKNSNQVLL
ncbi:MAG: hypothetical protein KAJ19_27255, partial [Gammaproteobacteria bacterium]|nr:hypothetical protein [Gammaproteobacteria bacterium]